MWQLGTPRWRVRIRWAACSGLLIQQPAARDMWSVLVLAQDRRSQLDVL